MVNTIVFIYGTLKTGEPNHHLLSEKKAGLCRLVGKARTVEKYPLVIASPFNIPFMLYEVGKGKNIKGELYEVDGAQLELMDDLEKHPHWYERMDVRVEAIGDNSETAQTSSGQSEILREETPQVNDGSLAYSRELTVHAYFLVKYQFGLLDLATYASYSNGIDGKAFRMPPNGDTEENTTWLREIHTEHEKLMKLMSFGKHLKG